MSNQLVITSGAKVRNLEGVLTGTSGIMGSVPLGGANGVATLDSGGKVPVSQLPSSVVTYLGTWNAATNTPTLTNGTGDAGDMYICNVAGTVNFGAGPITFAVGDWVLYGSGTWQKSSGQNGTVTSVAASITGNAIGITGSPITTAGTLAFAFAGTSGQYINGAGNLVTFPTIVTEAQRLVTEVYNETGATLSKGTVVYINGGHGNLPTVTKAIATGDSTSAQTYGVVQTDITNMNNGYVVVVGSLTDLDTQAYPDGTQLYLSSTTAGAWTSTKQYAPAHLVYVGIVVRSHPTQGVVEVRIQNGFELDELHNVSAQTPSNGNILQYVSSTQLWTAVAGTTTNIAEGTNLYYTDARSRAAFSETVTGLDYNSTTGVLSTTTGYGIPTTIKQSNWDDAYTWVAAFPTQTGNSGKFLTTDGSTLSWAANPLGTVTSVAALTIGTSGTDLSSTVANSTTTPVITLNVPTASATNRGALSSADWTTFNNKQSALTFTSPLVNTSGTISISAATSSVNGYLTSTDWSTFNGKIGGGGTANYIPKYSGAFSLTDSIIYDNSGKVLINTTDSSIGHRLAVYSATEAAQFRVMGGAPSVLFTDTANASFTYSAYLGVVTSVNNFFTGSAIGSLVLVNNTSNQIAFAINNSLKMTLNASGNFSIGNTNNTYKLDVSGTARFTGQIEAPTAYFSTSITTDSMYTSNEGYYVIPGGGTSLSYLSVANTTTFNGTVTASAVGFVADMVNTNTPAFTINRTSTAYNGIIKFRTSNADKWVLGTRNTSDETFRLYNYNVAADVLIFANTGAATFSSSVTTNVGIIGNNSNHLYLSSNSSGGEISFWANQLGTRLMTITGAGNVGIGTTSPQALLQVTSSSFPVLKVADGVGGGALALGDSAISSNYVGVWRGAANSISGGGFLNIQGNGIAFMSSDNVFGSGTERMRITNTGNVGIGTSSPAAKLDLGSSYGSPKLYLYNDGTYVNGFGIYANEFRNFFDTIDAAASRMTWGKQTGGGTFTEFMRLTKDGNLLVGTTTQTYSTKLEVVSGGDAISSKCDSGGTAILCNPATTGSTSAYFKVGSTNAGYIGHPTSSTTSYNTSPSDERLKYNIEIWNENVLELFKNINPKIYSHISDNDESIRYKGFIAQQMIDKFPEAYPIDRQGFYNYNPSAMVVYLMKAIQEQQAQIEELKQLIK